MEFKVLDANGIKIRAAVEGEGPLVVMVHGCPESWYSWRHQIPVIAAAGIYSGSDRGERLRRFG